MLVRPDQHIAWRSRTTPDGATARQVIDVVIGRRWAASEPLQVVSPPIDVNATEAVSSDGQMRYVVVGDGVDQMRIHAAGDGEPRPFVRAGGVRAIATDDSGGVWVAGDTTFRFDSAGRPTHVVGSDH